MSAPINHGGPAFPPNHDPETHAFGMTLLDYFAAKAMHAIMATPRPGLHISSEDVASMAYQIAGEMIKARAA